MYNISAGYKCVYIGSVYCAVRFISHTKSILTIVYVYIGYHV